MKRLFYNLTVHNIIKSKNVGMLKLLFLILILFSSITIKAQIKWGVKLGGNVSSMLVDDNRFYTGNTNITLTTYNSDKYGLYFGIVAFSKIHF